MKPDEFERMKTTSAIIENALPGSLEADTEIMK